MRIPPIFFSRSPIPQAVRLRFLFMLCPPQCCKPLGQWLSKPRALGLSAQYKLLVDYTSPLVSQLNPHAVDWQPVLSVLSANSGYLQGRYGGVVCFGSSPGYIRWRQTKYFSPLNYLYIIFGNTRILWSWGTHRGNVARITYNAWCLISVPADSCMCYCVYTCLPWTGTGFMIFILNYNWVDTKNRVANVF